MNNIYVLLDEMRTSIISMDLSYSQTTELLNQILEIEKTIDSEERPQGEWVVLVDEDNIQTCKCSICGRMVDIGNRAFDKYPYCHCGAKMKGDVEE